MRKAGEDLRRVLREPELQRRFAALGTYARSLSSAETAEFIRSEQALWRPIVRQVGMASH